MIDKNNTAVWTCSALKNLRKWHLSQVYQGNYHCCWSPKMSFFLAPLSECLLHLQLSKSIILLYCLCRSLSSGTFYTLRGWFMLALLSVIDWIGCLFMLHNFDFSWLTDLLWLWIFAVSINMVKSRLLNKSSLSSSIIGVLPKEPGQFDSDVSISLC